ncbi:hypothetical protein [Lactococcus lactis]|uniref:hypothetical protein n=1 Tax=Lactococcus lactis TaxID=1358 RepID=UPI00210E473B|nr:hypothetical protein [Lactococcus lactis]MCQ4972608.1 hypothetical protein [Lactococcus lactis]MCQ4998392.1 hypothetical protein [Lactococcus lactis]
MQIWMATLLPALIPSLVTVVSSYIINRKNNELKSELNNQEARFKNELEKQKKIAEIYYEERAKVLQEVYILFVNRQNNVVALLKFLGQFAERGNWPNRQVFHDTYAELIKDEVKLVKVLLYASLYLKDDDFKIIKDFHHTWNEPVGHIVDLYVLYEKIPNKDSGLYLLSDKFDNFSKEATKHNIRALFTKYSKESKNFEQIKNILRNAIASEEM